MTPAPGVQGALAVEAEINAWIATTRSRAQQVLVARKNCDVFARHVLKDERTGKSIVAAPVHKYWHNVLERSDRCVIWSHVDAGKTQQLAVARPIWRVGRNPNRRVAIVSNTMTQASKIIRTIGQYLESSKEVKEVFPHLRPARNSSLPWTHSQLTVERSAISKDPTFQACGVHGNIMGARIDDLVLDDILDFENTRTKHARDELLRWILNTLIGRLTDESTVWVIGNAWHPEDAMHELAKMPRFTAYRFPVVRDGTEESTWPVSWTPKRIAKAREDMGPLEFARQLLCRSRDDSSARFKREWIDVSIGVGRGFRMVPRVKDLPNGYAIFHGVDLAVSKRDSADLTVIFTGLLHPDFRRQVLNIAVGRWSGPEILQRIEDIDARYGGIFMVENVASQQYLVQFAQTLTRATVAPFTTGKNKVDPTFGVESLAAELAAGKWIIPNHKGKMEPEVEAWVSEMLYYDPAQHTGDRLMACLPPGQLVTTARGLVPIEAVVEGDQVLTHKARWRRVTGTTHREWSGELVELRGRGMTPLRCTPEHPVWSAEAWFKRDGTNRLQPVEDSWAFRDAKDVRVGRKDAGMYLLAPAALWPCEVPTEVDPGLALLTGLFLAEGTAKHHQVSFGLHEREGYLHALVAQEARRLWSANTSIYRRAGSKGVEVTVHSRVMANYFRGFGKRTAVQLPWDWMALPVDLGLLIVRGWLLGDGNLQHSQSGSSLCGVSISRGLLYQMQQFLWRAGYGATLTVFKQSGFFQGKPCGQCPAWRLALSTSDSARLLALPLAVEAERWVGARWRTPRDVSNTGTSTCSAGALVRAAVSTCVPYAGPIHNLHVEEDESFVAEGIAVHNSWFFREACRKFERIQRRRNSRLEGGGGTVYLGESREVRAHEETDEDSVAEGIDARDYDAHEVTTQ